jgi:GDPmannose 4,6-dehydratase
LESFPALYKILLDVQPDECYHLAAQSFVLISFEDEFSTMQTNINGTHYLLAAIKDS